VEGQTRRTVFEGRRGTAAVSPRRPFAARGKYYLLSRAAGKFMPRRRKFNRAARTRVCSFFFPCSSSCALRSPSRPRLFSPPPSFSETRPQILFSVLTFRVRADAGRPGRTSPRREKISRNFGQETTIGRFVRRSHRSRNRFLCSRNSRLLGDLRCASWKLSRVTSDERDDPFYTRGSQRGYLARKRRERERKRRRFKREFFALPMQ